MNILITHHGDPAIRGSERILLTILKELCSKGYCFHLICNQKSLAILAAEYCKSVTISAPIEGSIINRAAAYACNIIQTAKAIRSKRIDIVISNNLGTTNWVSIASLFTKCSLVSYIHTNYLPRARLLSLVYLSDAIIGVSNFVLADFARDRFSKENVFKIWNGTDISDPPESKEKIRKELGIPQDSIVGLTIGAFVGFKRFDIFLEASREAHQRNQNFVAIICGDGPLRSELEARYQGPSVRFLGWRDDVPRVIKAADFLISCSDREAFGLSIIEAAALGKPAIIANHGGQAEIVTDGYTGYHFAVNSTDDCAIKIDKMTRSAAIRDQLGAGAYKGYQANFTNSRMITKIENCLIEVRSRGVTKRSRLNRLAQCLKSSGYLIAARVGLID